jgi:predicted ATPase
MHTALERHDAIMRQAIEAHGGHVFRIEGDAFRAAFTTAPAALAAALDAQRALGAEPWPPETGPIRVRMALHTGAVEARDSDYSGPSLNRMARLLSVAHGGQTLLSLPAEQLVRDTLPPAATLLDMGEHRLKDLIRPERIFQLVAPGLPSDFPPLRSLDSRPNNLPLQPTPFIGREKELATIADLLCNEDVRLVTLFGPGGSGKTRLSLQVAAEMIDRFKDGVFFVSLAPISDPALVPSEIAQTLGISEARERSLLESLKDYVRDKHLLLVLDNFEQVVVAGLLVSQLLQAAPGLKMLVTSRAILHLRGEKDFPVPPLQMPDPRHLPSLEQLSQYEAVRLFIERARDARPDFEVTNENAPAVAEICYRLDGLPLAIELAAARIRILPPQGMLARLQSRLKMLTGGARDLPARQQTLRGAIEWSYDLLDEGEKRLFRRVALFQGGSTLEATDAVCNAEHNLGVDVLDGIASLVDKSLVRQEEREGGESRFVMLETIREYATEKLEESLEAEAVGGHHARYYLAVAEEAASELRGPRQLEWLDRLEAEHDNLRAALEWTLAAIPGAGGQARAPDMALRLGAALSSFWTIRGYLTEGRSWLERALDTTSEDTMARASALAGAGYMTYFHGDLLAARTLLEESIRVFRQMGDRRNIAYPLAMLAVASLGLGEYAGARVSVEEAVDLARRSGDKWMLAGAIFVRSLVATGTGDRQLARNTLEESLALYRQTGDRWSTGLVLQGYAIEALEEGDYASARASFEECLAIYRDLKDRSFIAVIIAGLGHTMHIQSDHAQANAYFEEALSLHRDLGNRYGIASTLMHMAMTPISEGNYDRAATLLEESLSIYRELESKEGVAVILVSLGKVEQFRGNYQRAGELLRESLLLYQEMGNKKGIAESLAGLARLTSAIDEPERVAKLCSAAEALLAALSVRLGPRDRAEFDRNLEAARAQLGEPAYGAAWEEGRAMTLEKAISLALRTAENSVS